MNKIEVLIIESNVLIRKFLANIINNTKIAEVKHVSPDMDVAVMWLARNTVNMIVISSEIINALDQEIQKKFFDCYEQTIIINRSMARNLNKFNFKPNDLEYKFIDINTDKIEEENIDALSEQFTEIFCEVNQKKNNEPKVQDLLKANIQLKKYSIKNWNYADLVLIASSIGGPTALRKIFEKIPKDFTKPILVVQHILAGFTEGLVKGIRKVSSFNLVEGKNGDEIKNGKAIFAPGGYHMIVNTDERGVKKISLINTNMVNGVRPAADVLFKSVAQEYRGKNILIVILTGMGHDGAEGVKEIKNNCNCYCITQKISTCVACGMPKAVQILSLSDDEVDIDLIADKIVKKAN